MATYRLLPHCRFVAGARRAAIYDLRSGRVYSVDEIGREILLGERNSEDFWTRLCVLGLAEKGVANGDDSLGAIPLNLLRYL